MRDSTPGFEATEWQVESANDRFKSRWNDHLAWSTMIAVALHTAVIVLWPSWEALVNPEDEGMGRQPLAFISLSMPAGIAGDLGASLVEEDEGEGAPDAGEGSELSAWEAAGLSDAVRQLLRGPMPAPTIAEIEPESGEDPTTEGNTTRIGGGDALTAELEELPEADSLNLDFLASLRPELALLDPSSWVLVRNPSEVGSFMRRTGDRLRAPESAAASVAIWIDERGSVEWAEINQSSGRSELDEVALQLFNEVVAFHPARDQGVRVPISAIFWVNFPW